MAVNNGPSCEAFVFENTPIATAEGVLEFEDGQGRMGRGRWMIMLAVMRPRGVSLV